MMIEKSLQEDFWKFWEIFKISIKNYIKNIKMSETNQRKLVTLAPLYLPRIDYMRIYI